MPLHIVTGYDGPGAGATPRNLYTGRSRDEANRVMEADIDCLRYELVSNPRSIRKSSTNHPSIAKARAEALAATAASAAAQAAAEAAVTGAAAAARLAEARRIVAEAEAASPLLPETASSPSRPRR